VTPPVLSPPGVEGCIEARGLRTWFPAGGRWIGRRRWIRAVDGVTLRIAPGESVGLVGESGSGKTTLGRSLLRLVEPTAGEVRFEGIDMRALGGRELRRLRRRMQIVFQDPRAALSPRRQVGQILAEPLLLHGLARRREAEARVAALLQEVGLEPYFAGRYPHEMSGGQRQRVAIARALALRPSFLVADEPVSALDVSVRAHILQLLLSLHERRRFAMLFVSHDLAVIERVADRTAVMYFGRIVEEGPTAALIASPQHPYTQALLASVPGGVRARTGQRFALRGEAPSPVDPVQGCAFASRCPEVRDVCTVEAPLLRPTTLGRQIACHVR
jgi:oligopeptide/dipeptide ABC transporter ATP-binding protein